MQQCDFEAYLPSHIARNHWDQWQTSRSLSPSVYVDWGDHPTILAEVFRAAFGDPKLDFFRYFKEVHPDFARRSALSLCCGDGGFERALLDHGVFASITGIDLAPARIAAAREIHRPVADRLNFDVGDVNTGNFGTSSTDIVFAKAALHHVENLEQMASGICRALRVPGFLVAIDFFGPNRFQWTDAQLRAANWFLLNRVPPQLRARKDASVYEEVRRPTVAEMIALDPSEAVRSGELMPVLSRYFDFTVNIPLGGTLLNLIFFGDIINNFDESDPAHNQILVEACQYERALIDAGVIESDFRLIVAKPRV